MAAEQAYWTIEELSQYSRISTSTLYKWVHYQKIPFHKINGAVRFHIERTKRWLDSKEIKPKKYIPS